MKTTTSTLFDEAINAWKLFDAACVKYDSCDTGLIQAKAKMDSCNTELIQAKAKMDALLGTIYKCGCLPEFIKYIDNIAKGGDGKCA